MLGPSAAMSQLWLQIRRLAPHIRTVLLTGAPDCGQEAVARLLLDFSAAPKRNFVQVSAADAEIRFARPSGLSSLPADIFLFLPDIDCFSPAAAENLLRVLRMRRSRLFTVVAAATQDLHALAAAGNFPQDLALLLTSVNLELPELKQRREDVPMLLGQLLALRASVSGSSAPTLSQGFLHAAMDYAWPGNLRELLCVASSLVEDGTATHELTSAEFHRAVEIQPSTPVAEAKPARMISLEAVVQEHISSVLHACRGNKLRAAEILGISRSTLYRMLDAGAVHNTALCLAS